MVGDRGGAYLSFPTVVVNRSEQIKRLSRLIQIERGDDVEAWYMDQGYPSYRCAPRMLRAKRDLRASNREIIASYAQGQPVSSDLSLLAIPYKP